MSDLHVQGLRELQAKLKDMESKTSQKVLRSALMTSATPTCEKVACCSSSWHSRS